MAFQINHSLIYADLVLLGGGGGSGFLTIPEPLGCVSAGSVSHGPFFLFTAKPTLEILSAVCKFTGFFFVIYGKTTSRCLEFKCSINFKGNSQWFIVCNLQELLKSSTFDIKWYYYLYSFVGNACQQKY